MRDKDQIKQLTLRIPEELHREFKIYAAKQGQTMGSLAIKFIRKHLKKESDPL
ncbi:MAG: toxin-antitoxin system HicB family antitoxin [Desulfobacteraceae bacterium]|nr:MAG: toxin-antitoxin system HicB family antitoxin [Desulfobacteraceae bacterium]